MIKVLERRVMTVQIEGCHRPRRVYNQLCEYLDVPQGGEILLEAEDYVADDLRELAANTERYDGETRQVANQIADTIMANAGATDYVWVTY